MKAARFAFFVDAFVLTHAGEFTPLNETIAFDRYAIWVFKQNQLCKKMQHFSLF
jgi:hypothetical protein